MGNKQYQPVTAVWEVTMGCNMRCKHCGSSCAQPLPDELTTGEALDIIGQLSAIGLRWITLSGGEPLTRHDLSNLISPNTATLWVMIAVVMTTVAPV